jgi:hypothetical protein
VSRVGCPPLTSSIEGGPDSAQSKNHTYRWDVHFGQGRSIVANAFRQNLSLRATRVEWSQRHRHPHLGQRAGVNRYSLRKGQEQDARCL